MGVELAPLAELSAAKAACLITSPQHALMARQSERVKDVVARHVTAIRRLTMLVDKVGPPHTSPDVITLGTNLLKSFAKRDQLLEQLREVMKIHPPNPIGIDWATAIDLLTKAELNMDRPNHDQLAEVLNLVKQKPPVRAHARSAGSFLIGFGGLASHASPAAH